MISPKKIFLLFFILSFAFSSYAQEFIVAGQVKSNSETTFSNLLIVNKRTHNGQFGKPDGTFFVQAKPKDTLLIASIGYNTYILALPDTIIQDTLYVKITISKLSINLKEISVIPKRELSEITKEIKKLGYNKKDYLPNTIDAISSPITYLYMRYSKRGKDKRKTTKAKNADKRRALLKELLNKYVDADIIDLNNRQFDDFIDFAGITDAQMKNLSQYQFIMLVKKKFWAYKKYILRSYR